MLSERRRHAPWGLHGGASGRRGKNILIDGEGNQTQLPGQFTRRVNAGESLRIETPGGGGYSSDKNSRRT